MRARPLCAAVPRHLESSLCAARSPTPRPDPRLQRGPRRPLPARPALGTRRCLWAGVSGEMRVGAGRSGRRVGASGPGQARPRTRGLRAGPTSHCVKGQRSGWPLRSGMLPEGGWGAGSRRVPTSFQEETGPVKGGEEGLEVRSGVSCRPVDRCPYPGGHRLQGQCLALPAGPVQEAGAGIRDPGDGTGREPPLASDGVFHAGGVSKMPPPRACTPAILSLFRRTAPSSVITLGTQARPKGGQVAVLPPAPWSSAFPH